MILLLVPLVVILHYGLVTEWVLSLLLLIVSIPLVWMMYAHLNKRHQQENRFHELYFFLQQLIMTLSIKSNVYESYQDVLQNMHPSQQKRLLSFQATDVLVSLQSMHMYFKHPLYALSLEN
jgi:RsiW-degrading membrane proteinase PrsW (M82 family)